MGSNILNIFIILGLSALVLPLSVKKTTLGTDMPFLISVTLLLLIQGLDGIIQVGIFALYLAYLLITAKKAPIKIPKLMKYGISFGR